MPIYVGKLEYVEIVSFEVEAPSKEEAIEKVHEGLIVELDTTEEHNTLLWIQEKVGNDDAVSQVGNV